MVLLLIVAPAGCKGERSQDFPPIDPPSKHEVRGLPGPGVGARLRVTNSGSEGIRELRVRFPEDAVSFGDVRPGETTAYRDVPHGVFRYAAFEYVQDGRRMSPGVQDWHGEKGQGGNFTYRVHFAPVELGTGLIRRLLVLEEVNH